MSCLMTYRRDCLAKKTHISSTAPCFLIVLALCKEPPPATTLYHFLISVTRLTIFHGQIKLLLKVHNWHNLKEVHKMIFKASEKDMLQFCIISFLQHYLINERTKITFTKYCSSPRFSFLDKEDERGPTIVPTGQNYLQSWKTKSLLSSDLHPRSK